MQTTANASLMKTPKQVLLRASGILWTLAHFTCPVLLALMLLGFCPLLAQDISLPAPQKSGGMPLMDALTKRATSRSFDSKPLSEQQLSTLLWSAFGINRPDGKRTAPSANNYQATDIYVLLKTGTYRYEPKSNYLALVIAEDLRALGATQDFATNAPVTLIFLADLAKMGTGPEESKRDMANLNVGYISQNVYLCCASEGLATGARESVDRKRLSSRLRLRPEQQIILAQSVGFQGR
jgi:nitroreductase